MLDIGDPAFKLFGKTIPLLSSDEVFVDSTIAALSSERTKESKEAQRDAADKGQAEQKSSDESVLQDDPLSTSANQKELNADSQTASGKGASDDQSSPNSVDENSAAESKQDPETAQGDGSNNSPEKTLKKPDKILPCPRCNSMDTKFCYYNNYNVNQPRHFCKSCQRYWTAGGTMRSVPVGAGRRKNKSASSRYCHLSISEALHAARIDLPNGLHHPHKQPEAGLKMNGTVLNFGADFPLCESMASMLNLVENKAPNGTQNGIHVHCMNGDNVDDHSSGSSTVTTSSSKEEGGLKGVANSMHQFHQNIHGVNGQQVPCFPGFQLAYGWNPAVPMPPPPPGFFPSATFPPIPFYSAPYWNGAAIPWSIPWVSPCSLSPKGPGLNPTSPTLGKHSRDEDTLKPSSEADKSLGSPKVLVPKTLRIDDPEEAAKSSIWTTLGIKNVEPAGNGGFFKGLQSKSVDKKHKIESFPVLNANPAALARSISFQETA